MSQMSATESKYQSGDIKESDGNEPGPVCFQEAVPWLARILSASRHRGTLTAVVCDS